MKQHGLQQVAEAEAGVTGADNLPPHIADRLRAWTSDEVAIEQYTDFIVNRTFRRSLLTHAETKIDRTPDIARLEPLFASTAAKPVESTADRFTTERGQTFSATHPLAKRVLVALASVWPAQVSVAELRFDLRADDDLADLLVSLHSTGVVELDAVPRQCVNRVSERPRVSDLARRQAEAGVLVTSQRRRVLKLDDPVARFLIRHLDGTHDRTSLLRLLDREAASRRLDLSLDGQTTIDPRRVPMVLEAVLDHQLRKMVEYGMLVG